MPGNYLNLQTDGSRPATTNGEKRSLFAGPDGRSLFVTFCILSSLFLLWGCCSGLLDSLNKHFQNTLHLSKFESGFVQNAFYMGYFLMAFPAGMIARRFGYKGGIVTGLTLAAIGAFWVIPAIHINMYWAFLMIQFILASGLASLETNANPYSTVLGPVEHSATRINIAQTCNGIGWVLGMYIGAHFILSASPGVSTGNTRLEIPYTGIGIAAAILLVIFIVSKIPDLRAVEEVKAEAEGKMVKSIFKRSHFTFGVVSEFLYCAAQTGIFAFFINYAVANLHNCSDQKAGYMEAVAFVLFAGGRLIGSAVVGFTSPHKALAIYATINTFMMVLAMAGHGWAGVAGVMGSYLFMSIMFPTIFALSIRGLGDHTKFGSSLLVMSVVGGAIAAPLMGAIADRTSMQFGFIIPLACFVVIAIYGALWKKLEERDSAEPAAKGAS